MFNISKSISSKVIDDITTISTSLSLFDNNVSVFINDQTSLKYSNLTCTQIKYEYVSQKPLFNFVRYVTHNLNRFFILPAIILNLCAFYILRCTRMNRSSSIAFYMQTLALCDAAFFALRVLFGELSSLSANKHILTTGLCKFLFLMVNAVNYTTVWLIAAMNANKFLAVCLPLRVSDLLSRKKAYAVVIAVISCSMLVASVHASRTVLKNNSYCWLKTSQDEKLVFILDAFVWCFVPFIVISILNAAIFLALFRARREASHLHETTAGITQTSKNQLVSTVNNRTRVQSQNLQITIMLITISISFFVLTLPNAIYYLLIFLRVFIESWKAVKCDANVYRNLDTYVKTSAVMYLISNITSDLMHVVNFFLYFISGVRFRAEFRRLIFHRLCNRCYKQKKNSFGKESTSNERSFLRKNGAAAVRALSLLPGDIKQRCATNDKNCITSIRDKQTVTHLSSTKNGVFTESLLTSGGSQSFTNQYKVTTLKTDDKIEMDNLLYHV
ncbi:unnamed protein product [Rotaria magnacalcarata]|uniref:G-protein coupled receptors family 1 profile domain-containing protein n=2 Tax=Rotaria magnacalcarata TaxID=392030 RepID=A0A815BRE9_9BILA|nr:unnamed protein product [Rotaria magnacalcarata]CAF1598897.1 unnamed protein product [Rotaria magnacalcarata]CAF2145062.1 unnamed protein product [Rotaria magnacalcarata]CAF3770511.1 unnamed protein product [Rotaria magnacalcarata]CAF3803457.1 unnamed protein product [Rotaria magnacalcarata]